MKPTAADRKQSDTKDPDFRHMISPDPTTSAGTTQPDACPGRWSDNVRLFLGAEQHKNESSRAQQLFEQTFDQTGKPMPRTRSREHQQRIIFRQRGQGYKYRLAALEPHREVIGEGVHRDPLLRHVIALAHGDGVVLK